MAAAMAMTAVSTYMSYGAAKQDQQAALGKAYYDREMSEYNAEQVREQSRQKAERIFERARRLRGQQMVAQAASGAVIGEGSAGAVLDETNSLAARDALVTLYSGIEGAVAERQEGRMAFKSGVSQAEAAGQRATATLIGGAGQMAGQYHTYKALNTPRESV